MDLTITKRTKLLMCAVLLSVILLWVIKFLDLSYNVYVEEHYGENWWNIGSNLFYIANWPRLLLEIYPVSNVTSGVIEYNVKAGFFHPLVMLVNAIGWGLIGLIGGALILIKKPEGMSLSFSDLKAELFLQNKAIRATVIFWLLLLFGVIFFGFSIAIMQSFLSIPLLGLIIIAGIGAVSLPVLIPILLIVAITLLIKRDRKNILTTLQRVTLWCVIITSIFFFIYSLPIYFMRF